MKALILVFLIGLTQSVASADFGEIDIVVRESIQNYFDQANKEVDMNKLEYYKLIPTEESSLLKIETNVWAEQEMVHPHWGWHECLTEIEIGPEGQYKDLGTECFFDFD